MRKQTDLAKVKQTARSLLFTDIHETEFSPVIVSHPFTDSGFGASPNADGEIGLLNITESDADQRRWREYTEEEQFYEAMKQEGFTELKDLINLSFNLNKYCLIQNIGNMGKIGQEYLLNRDGAIPANDDANPKYAEIGRRLMQSGTGIVTEHGIFCVFLTLRNTIRNSLNSI